MLRCSRLLAALLAVAVSSTPAWSRAAGAAADLERRLRAAVEEGRLDPGEADVYRLYAVRAPERLPAEYRVDRNESAKALRDSSGGVPAALRCGTPTLRAVRERLPDLPADLRAEAETLLDSTRAAPGKTVEVGAKSGATLLPHWIVTENFSIEWGPNLTDEDGSTPPRDDDGNGIPDVVEVWASVFEASYREESDAMGFTHPSLSASLIPVYIGNSDPTTLLEDVGSGTYAFTESDGHVPYIVVNNDFSFLNTHGIINGEGRADPNNPLANIHGAMKITAAHEFFHVIHFLYEPDAWKPRDDDWWFEASATWMEDEVFDGVNDYHQYYRGFSPWTDFVEAGLPVAFSDFYYVTRAYGATIFAKYLSEHVGGRRSMADVWDLIRQPPGLRILAALEQYALSQGFAGGLAELFLGFSAANAVMDYEEGGVYGLVPVRMAGNSLEVDSATGGVPVPAYLGATYVLRDGGGSVQGLGVDVRGVPARTWGLGILLDRSGGYSLALGAIGETGDASVSVAAVSGQDVLYAIPSYLDAGAVSTSYKLSEQAVSVEDALPPGAVADLAATEVPGGFDLSWGAPGAADVAGYVVKWNGRFRTLFGPVTAAEVRNLEIGAYDVEVFAYDTSGNVNPADAASIRVFVSERGSDVPTPPAQVRDACVNPVADAGDDGVAQPGSTVMLDGSGSANAGGAVTTYHWSQVLGPTVPLIGAEQSQAQLLLPLNMTAPTVLVFETTVTNECDLSATDTVAVTLLSGGVSGLPPKADAGTDQSVNEGSLVILDGTNSSDPEGTRLSYAWHQTPSTTVTLSSPSSSVSTFTAPRVALPGERLQFFLLVTDSSGLAGADSVQVQVQDSEPAAVPSGSGGGGGGGTCFLETLYN